MANENQALAFMITLYKNVTEKLKKKIIWFVVYNLHSDLFLA